MMKSRIGVQLTCFIILLMTLFTSPVHTEAADVETDQTQGYTVSTLQTDLDSIIERYQPIAVSIVTSKDLSVSKKCVKGDALPIDKTCVLGTVQKLISRGTGFVVRKDGIIVTNEHVVSDVSANQTVIFSDKSEYKVMSTYRDQTTDIALLKIIRNDLPTAVLGDSSLLRIGQFVVTIGNTLGEYPNSVSFGIVSGLGRTISSTSSDGNSSHSLGQVIQTDAAINPGNSGGPLINMKGEVVGIVTAKTYGADNVGFAIPINTVKEVMIRYFSLTSK